MHTANTWLSALYYNSTLLDIDHAAAAAVAAAVVEYRAAGC
jgi:hypothetical protein